jgi:hypothetical protein
VEAGVGVYQCVDVTNVTTVLSLLIKTTTAVLVDSAPGVDETISTVETCTKEAIVVEAGAGAEYVDDVMALDAASVLEVGAVVDDKSDVVVATEDEADVETDEVEAAAQATFRANCTPLLAQVESNVAAAAVHGLAMERGGSEFAGAYILDRHRRNSKQGSSASLPDRLVGKYRRCLCCCKLKVQLPKCMRPAMV